MKISGIIIGLCFWSVSVVAQNADDDQYQAKTLLSKYQEIRGFGALDIKLTDLASKQAMVVGAYGGVIVNKQVMLGLGGYGFATNGDVRRGGEDVAIEGGYGGMMLGFIIAPREVVHLSIPVFIGAGTFHAIDERFDRFNNFSRDIILESSSFAVIEPGLQLELNVTRNVRLNFGASYRLIQGSNLRDISDEDLSDFTGNVTLKIGKF